MACLPLGVGHAVELGARVLGGEGDAAVGGAFGDPAAEAVAAEARERHQVEVLHLRMRAEMVAQAAERGRLELGAVGGRRGLPRLAECCPEDRRQAVGPSGLRLGRGAEVVADLEERVEPSGLQRVAVHRVARQVAVVGLVVADDEIGLGPETRDQRERQPVIAGVEHPDQPGPRRAAHERGREAVHGEDDRVGAPRREAGDGVVVGPVEAREPVLDACRVDAAVCRDQRAVVELHHQRRVVLAAVGVDHQPREVRHHERGIEPVRERPRHACGANVERDVPRHVGGRDPEVAARDRHRHPVRRVVAGDEPARRPVLPLDDHRCIVRHHSATFPEHKVVTLTVYRRQRRRTSCRASECVPYRGRAEDRRRQRTTA